MVPRVRTSSFVVLFALLVGLLGALPVRAHAQGAPELARFNDLLTELVEKIKPGLVFVRVQRNVTVKDDERETRRSQGSGFVIEPDGLIVTNAHVVEGAQTIRIQLHDGRRFEGKVVGQDSRTDLALVKIAVPAPLVALKLGDSNRARVGEFVLALGHPFGLEESVSFGIVGRKGSPLRVAAPPFDWIQTDAAINPGNSGGPLVNMAGEVIGVNTMLAGNGSIGFAIPASLVSMLTPQLIAKGKMEWGWLGVRISEVTEEDQERLKLPGLKGVVVQSVNPGEPAEQGGVKANDIITMFDGRHLDTSKDLQRSVSASPVGAKVRLGLLREGQATEVEVTIGLYKEPERVERASQGKDKKPDEKKPDEKK